jgi:TetR/AcrR family transcriptional regulator, transcriptional repressor for nem operon
VDSTPNSTPTWCCASRRAHDCGQIINPDGIRNQIEGNVRDKLLTKGLRVVHQQGLVGASVRDIVEAAGVPQGSFSNHFASKEAFGVEILDLYFGFTRKVLAETLNNKELTPLRRLEAYIDANQAFLEQWGVENGCLYGNYAAELTGHDEPIRRRLVEIFNVLQDSLTACLKDAVNAEELPKDFKCKEIGDFILSSLQGAILLSKGKRDTSPLAKFKRVLFGNLLR